MVFSVKLYWSNPTTLDVLSIRRLRTPEVPTWADFLEILKPLFPGNDGVIVTWRDEEDDLISIGSQVEWDEAVESTTRPMKLIVMPNQKKEVNDEQDLKKEVKEEKEEKEVEEEEQPSENEKPTFTPEYFYSASGTLPSLPPADNQRLSGVVQSILTRYSAAPPQWLAAAIRVIPTENDFLVDVDISQLSTLLHRRAYHLLSNDGSVETALELLNDCLCLFPDDTIARYNRACCYARLGRVDESFAEIVKYFEFGGRDFATLKTDEDLASLRACARFVEYVKNTFHVDVSEDDVSSSVSSSVFESVVGSMLESRVEDNDENTFTENDDEEEDEEEEDEDEDEEDGEDEDDDSVFESQLTESCVDNSQALESQVQDSEVLESQVDMSYITESQLDMSALQSVPPIAEPEEEEEEEEEESAEEQEMQKKLDLLGDFGFTDREMVRKVLEECDGDVERFLDEQCA